VGFRHLADGVRERGTRAKLKIPSSRTELEFAQQDSSGTRAKLGFPSTLTPRMSRPISLLLVSALALAACGYESAGTTTTTTLADDEAPPSTGPADIVASDQMIEGSSLVVDSVSLPSPGFVVVRMDAGGSPGQVIGISELLTTGVISGVPIPFFVPLAEEATVHLTIHIDVDRDERFTYEPPDAFVDEIATRANGEPATTTALLTLLAPISPADVFADPQTNNGATIEVASATLPSPGWVAIHASLGGEPGEVLAVSEMLPVGVTNDLVFAIDPPLESTQGVFVVVWIDRDGDGVFDPAAGADEIGVREDGALAIANPVITVLARSPGELFVLDQDSDGTSVFIDSVRLPSPGFVEILTDDGGSPGNRVAVSIPLPAGTSEVEIDLDPALAETTILWARLWIDFDQDGTLSAGDLTALDEPDGSVVQDSFELEV